MSEIKGAQLIAGEESSKGSSSFQAANPANQDKLEPSFPEASSDEISQAMEAAEASFEALRTSSAETRADLLDAIADEIMNLGDALLERAHQETGLPMPRLTGERGRAVGQSRLFANLLRDGSWVDARIDTAIPDREPLPKPDVRLMKVAIGPVVVFGASNFPLAISVVGSDTVSALGAGCPVVVKGHPAHPGTCELLGRAINAAVKKVGLPAGCFSLIQGVTTDTGMGLVNHPLTKAVAFTGSLRGGRALADAAAARPVPIPVYAEMGSTNPVFVLPGAMAERSEAIANGYVQSVTLGVGQFCTNPGLLLGLKGSELDGFKSTVKSATEAAAPATMLHAGISGAFSSGLEKTGNTEGVNLLAKSATDADSNASQAACTIFNTSAENFLSKPELVEENFGPSSIIIDADSPENLETIASSLDGHLTATVHGTEEDLKTYARLISILQTKVGRIIFNGFPTGIEVCPSMHHGGAYPATTHSYFTSIGTSSIERFVRPLCFQGFPDAALPAELQNSNPRGIMRTLNGELTRDPVA